MEILNRDEFKADVANFLSNEYGVEISPTVEKWVKSIFVNYSFRNFTVMRRTESQYNILWSLFVAELQPHLQQGVTAEDVYESAKQNRRFDPNVTKQTSTVNHLIKICGSHHAVVKKNKLFRPVSKRALSSLCRRYQKFFEQKPIADIEASWFSANTIVHVISFESARSLLSDCLDYLVNVEIPEKALQRMTVEHVMEAHDKRVKKKNEEAKVERSKNLEPIFTFPDGSYVVQLLTEEDYEYEGKVQKHCIADYHGRTNIECFSWRSPEGKSLCSISTRHDGVKRVNNSFVVKLKLKEARTIVGGVPNRLMPRAAFEALMPFFDAMEIEIPKTDERGNPIKFWQETNPAVETTEAAQHAANVALTEANVADILRGAGGNNPEVVIQEAARDLVANVIGENAVEQEDRNIEPKYTEAEMALLEQIKEAVTEVNCTEGFADEIFAAVEDFLDYDEDDEEEFDVDEDEFEEFEDDDEGEDEY